MPICLAARSDQGHLKRDNAKPPLTLKRGFVYGSLGNRTYFRCSLKKARVRAWASVAAASL